jgi:hypothetical protein
VENLWINLLSVSLKVPYIITNLSNTLKNKKYMAFAKLEYIWLDGYKPTQSLRSKTKIVHDFSGKLEDCP